MKMGFLRDTIIILQKDLRQYYLKPPTLSWGFITPIAIVAMLVLAASYNWRIISGVIALAMMWSSTTMGQVAMGIERKARSIEKLLYTPINLASLVTAKVLSGLIFGFIGAGIASVIASVLTPIHVIHVLPLIIAIILGSIVFSLIGSIIALLASIENSMVVMNILRFTMMFLSGIFIPVFMLPWFLQPVSYVLPLTYVVELMRYSFYGIYDVVNPVTSIVALIIILIFYTVYLWLLLSGRTMEKIIFG